LEVLDLVGIVEQNLSAGIHGPKIERRRFGQGSGNLARSHGLKSFGTPANKEQSIRCRRDALALHDIFKNRRGNTGQAGAGDLLTFEVGERFELRVANHLIGIAVGRAADDFDVGAARRRDYAKMSSRSGQVNCSGDQCFDDEVRLHVGDV
jgi:hypothetical protein